MKERFNTSRKERNFEEETLKTETIHIMTLRVEMLNDHVLYRSLSVTILLIVSRSRLFCENNSHAE